MGLELAYLIRKKRGREAQQHGVYFELFNFLIYINF